MHNYDLMMAATYLDNIVTWHRARARADLRSWKERVQGVHYDGPSMWTALTSTANDYVKVIAEVKRRSPSKGWIDEKLDPVQLARAYRDGGASAISVLTDEPHFAGSRADLQAVCEAVDLPVLRKDFTVSANDVLDTVQMGASTVLLIVAALSDEELGSFIELAHQCGLDALVEVHSLEEAKRSIDHGARIIGVNQRDLHSFEVNPQHAATLIASIPTNIVTVAESGMTSSDDVERAAAAGFDAVLVGETFVRALDPSEAVRSFTRSTRVHRG